MVSLFAHDRDLLYKTYDRSLLTLRCFPPPSFQALEEGFANYMPSFQKWLEFALRNWKEHAICTIAVGVVGDICRAMGPQILPYCDSILLILLENLRVSITHTHTHTHTQHYTTHPLTHAFLVMRGAFSVHFRQNTEIHRDVKPPILSCFGDIALAVGGAFEKYLHAVMGMLQQASTVTIPDYV